MDFTNMTYAQVVSEKAQIKAKLGLIDIWRRNGERNGWTMPSAPWWKRLPVIRHLRAVRNVIRIEAWYAYGPGQFGVRTGRDEWITYGIWKGQDKA